MLKSSKEMLAFVPVKTIEDLPPAQLQSFCGSEAMTADLPEKMVSTVQVRNPGDSVSSFLQKF